MASVFYIVFALLVYAQTSQSQDFLICKSTADDLFKRGTGSCQETTDRIQALEEQVRQLQDVITAGNFSNSRSRHGNLPADCGEIFANGTRRSGVYLVSPDGRCPFKVYCDMTDDGWTVIQKRIDGSVNFYRTWIEYVEGFGDIDGEHWLGLEKIHRLTREGSDIYFDIGNYDGSRDHAHYKSFTVHDVTTAYTMNVDPFGYEGTLDELLSYHNNMKFSTFDRDNDRSSTNCANTMHGGAWWYNDCYRLGNPNGVFGKKDGGGLGFWSNRFMPVHTFSIKIRHIRGMC